MTPLRRGLAAWSLVLVGVLAAGCSTTGRDLREPSMSTLAPSLSGPTTTAASPTTPIEGMGGFALSSPEFLAGGELPIDGGAKTGNRSPALSWTSTPESAAELALVVTDDTGAVIYWLVTGLVTTDIDVPGGSAPSDGIEHASTAGPVGWSGPVAAPGAGQPVVFALYALDEPVIAADGETSHSVRERIIAASFATATLRGTFDGDGASLQPG